MPGGLYNPRSHREDETQVKKSRKKKGGRYGGRYKNHKRGLHLSKGKAMKRKAMKDAPADI